MSSSKTNFHQLVGIDVGENSVGLASIICDETGMPVAVPHLLTVIHDSGKDGMASGQTSTVSRKASGGTARRARTLLKNRRRRSRRLASELAARGYPIVPPESIKTYDEWRIRQALLAGPIADPLDSKRQLSIAIRHMANRRGWANAWISIDKYVWQEEPSKEFVQAVQQILDADRFGEIDRSQLRHQSDLAMLGLRTDERLRQRSTDYGKSPNAVRSESLLGLQRRADVVREWHQICRVQGLPDDEFLALARIAFGQERPKVPAENVGKDWLPGFKDHLRASIASLEHQEFQIRQTIADLRIREGGDEKRRLTIDEQHLIVDHLMGVTDASQAPTWAILAQDFLHISPRMLVHNEADQSLTGKAPVMRSITALWALPKKHPVIEWWRDNPTKRAAFIVWISDPADIVIDGLEEFEEFFETLGEKELEAVSKLKFPSGRSRHSLAALRMMAAELERSGDSYVEVRNRLFNNGDDLRPTERQTLDTAADHPTLQRVLPIVRRFLLGVDRNDSAPVDRVVVEHVRSSLLGFNARKEFIEVQRKNRNSRELARQEIAKAGLGIANPSEGEIKKFQALRRQNSTCLYCGAAIDWTNSQMDHIVPRKTGGNNTRANLIAVCVACNQAKGKRPFAVFANSGVRPSVGFDAAINRVEAMNHGEMDPRAFKHIKAEMKRRLKQTDEDEAIDERSLGSTAYAATDMVERIKNHYDDPTGKVAKVYNGRIVSEARRASGIDKRIQLRPGLDSKSRFDRRHHAVDAVVAALITPTVARVLAARSDLRDANRNTGSFMDWKEYEGADFVEQKHFREWKVRMAALVSLVEAKVAEDSVVVMQPVRYSASHSALHEDGRKSHSTKSVGAAWSPQERALIVDDRVYEQLSLGLAPGDVLPEDQARTLRLPSGQLLQGDGKVFIFPDTAARIALPNHSSAKLGSSIHHARLYRWRDQKGKAQAQWMRFWAADLYDLEGGTSGDLLTAPIRDNAKALRRSNVKLRQAFHRGEAEHVGTLMVGDEIYLEPSEWAGDNEPGRFLAEWPERHWRLAGLMSDIQFTLTPFMLSSEGAYLEGSNDPRAESGLVAVTELARKVISDRLIITSSALWNTKSTLVIRRTALGKRRDSTANGLPTTWSPYLAVHE